MILKKGTKLVLVDSAGMAAATGALASLTEDYNTEKPDEYIWVTWLDNKANGQRPGGYNFSNFRRAPTAWGELLK